MRYVSALRQNKRHSVDLMDVFHGNVFPNIAIVRDRCTAYIWPEVFRSFWNFVLLKGLVEIVTKGTVRVHETVSVFPNTIDAIVFFVHLYSREDGQRVIRFRVFGLPIAVIPFAFDDLMPKGHRTVVVLVHDVDFSPFPL